MTTIWHKNKGQSQSTTSNLVEGTTWPNKWAPQQKLEPVINKQIAQNSQKQAWVTKNFQGNTVNLLTKCSEHCKCKNSGLDVYIYTYIHSSLNSNESVCTYSTIDDKVD